MMMMNKMTLKELEKINKTQKVRYTKKILCLRS